MNTNENIVNKSLTNQTQKHNKISSTRIRLHPSGEGKIQYMKTSNVIHDVRTLNEKKKKKRIWNLGSTWGWYQSIV